MKYSLKCAALIAAACLPLAAHAHRAYLLPSATVLSDQDAWVSIEASSSDELFYPDHALKLDGLTITAPDGATVAPDSPNTGHVRSTFDLHLSKPGTYKLAVVTSNWFATYKDNGQDKRWRGTPEAFSSEVPATAQELKVTVIQARAEAFVTSGKPSSASGKPSGVGLELVPATHPNDLFAGEAASFRLLLDGKPAAATSVVVTPGGIRYRSQLNDINVTTDKNGQFSVTWPQPGLYLVSAAINDKAAPKPAQERRLSYSLTVEVLGQ